MSRPQKQTTRRFPIGLFLLVAFITVPLAEIAVFIQVGGVIGVGWTLGLIVITAMIGAWMLRWQGFMVLRRAQSELRHDRIPVQEVFEGLCLVVAGALLLTPGFITDAVGALLLVPPVRARLYRLVSARIEARILREGVRPGPAAPIRPEDEPVVFDAEFEEVDPKESEREPLPPPRGDWGRRR